jgi:hypothetical protein
MARYTGDVSFLKAGMTKWMKAYNASHSDDITIEEMTTGDNWGTAAATNFWRMHTRVSWLVYEAYPTVQLYNLCYPSQPA